jgi:ubiquinone/menaquinone biosynthesis C-methylase UbiE
MEGTQTRVTVQHCPVCSAPAQHRFEKHGHAIHSCSGCGLVFTVGPWSLAQARLFYGRDYFRGATPEGYTDYAGLDLALRRTARRRLRRLPPGGRLLDIGCATGTFIAETQAVYRAAGTDISFDACRVARSRGLDVVVTDAAALPFASASHDVITMWDTLEHIADPVAVLAEVARVLRPGGTLALTTGDVSSWCARRSGRRWHLYTVPEHRYFFSPHSLIRMFDRVGLRRTACYHEGGYYSLAYLFERVVKSLGASAGAIERLHQWRCLREASLYVNLFDIMTVEAVRAASPKPREVQS